MRGAKVVGGILPSGFVAPVRSTWTSCQASGACANTSTEMKATAKTAAKRVIVVVRDMALLCAKRRGWIDARGSDCRERCGDRRDSRHRQRRKRHHERIARCHEV